LKCDGKGPTFTLMKVKNGPCIGGFTEKQWEANEKGKPVDDSKAMLFNLTNKRFFKCKKSEKAIICHQNYGPHFGGNEAELSVYSDR
jgi:TLD